MPVNKTPKMLEIEQRFGKDLEGILREKYVDDRMKSYEVGEQLKVSGTTICFWLHKYGLQIRTISETKLPADFIKPSKEQLKQWYDIERLSTVDIGKQLGVSNCTVGRWLRGYCIPLRTNRESHMIHNVKLLPKEELRRLYVDKRMNFVEIGKELEVSAATVGKWVRRYDIPTRSASEARLPIGFVKPSNPELKQIYVVEGKTAVAIAKQYSVSRPLVFSWLRDYHIPIRNASKARLPIGFVKPSISKLNNMYVKQGMTTCEIARKYKISSTAVNRWLREYEIPIRNNRDSHLPAGVVKPSEKQLRQWYVVERMSTVDIAKKLKVDTRTIGKWLYDCQIPRRDRSESRLSADVEKPSEKQLRQWCVIDKIGSKTLGERIGVSPCTVRRWLCKYNIFLKSCNSKINKDSVKDLLKTYVGEKKYA